VGKPTDITPGARLCDLKSRNGLAYLWLGSEPAERFKPSTGREGFDTMEDFAHALADFVPNHQAWAASIVLLLLSLRAALIVF